MSENVIAQRRSSLTADTPGAYLVSMRPLVLAAALLLAAPTAALAFCPVIPADTAAEHAANQRALIACQQRELDIATKLRQQQLDFQALLAAQMAALEARQRLQQTYTAPTITLPTL